MGIGIVNPRGVTRFGPEKPMKFLTFRLNKTTLVEASLFQGKAQVDVVVFNRPGSDMQNPLRIFLGTYDGQDIDPATRNESEFENCVAAERWPEFVLELSRTFPAAAVMFA